MAPEQHIRLRCPAHGPQSFCSFDGAREIAAGLQKQPGWWSTEVSGFTFEQGPFTMNAASRASSARRVTRPPELSHPVWCDPRYCTVRSNLIDAKGRAGAQQGHHRARLNRRTTLNSAGLELTVGHQSAADRAYPREIWVQLASVEQSIELNLTPGEAFRLGAALVDAVDSKNPRRIAHREVGIKKDTFPLAILVAQIRNAAAALVEFTDRIDDLAGRDGDISLRRDLLTTLQYLDLAVGAAG
jgi:hypothetical protein